MPPAFPELWKSSGKAPGLASKGGWGRCPSASGCFSGHTSHLQATHGPSTAPAKTLGSNRRGSSPARLRLLHTLSDMQNVSPETAKSNRNNPTPAFPASPGNAASSAGPGEDGAHPPPPARCFLSACGFLRGNYIIEQNLDCPVSLETSSLFLSRTRMASLPYCEYHMLLLRLR